jgi:hypothetical protein
MWLLVALLVTVTAHGDVVPPVPLVPPVPEAPPASDDPADPRFPALPALPALPSLPPPPPAPVVPPLPALDVPPPPALPPAPPREPPPPEQPMPPTSSATASHLVLRGAAVATGGMSLGPLQDACGRPEVQLPCHVSGSHFVSGPEWPTSTQGGRT